MKNLSFLLAVSFLFIVLFQSCKKVSGDGPVVTETRSVANFSEIKSEFSGDIYITHGLAYSVIIEAQQNIIDVIETSLSDGMLTLRVKNNTVIRPEERVKVHIISPNVTALMVNGSGNMQVLGDLPANDLYMRVSGSGNINISKLTANSVDANISGSGEISIYDGTVNKESLDIGGSGSIDLLHLLATKGDIKIAGSGDAKVQVTGDLKVRITGSGSVYYKGTPALDVNITGSGKLKHL